MSRSDNSIPEPAIKVLLREDSPEKLSTDQRARLRARLGLIDESEPSEEAPSEQAPSDESQLTVMALSRDISTTRAPIPPRRNQPAWLAAAAAVVVAGLLVLLIGNQPDDSGEIRVTDTEAVPFPTAQPTAQPTEEPAAARVCREHIRPFTTAIEAWDGIDNWAFLTDKRLPEPDLVTLALDSLSAIEDIATLGEASETQQTLIELRADVATGTQAEDPLDWTALDRDAHRAAVVAALVEITDLIDREGWAIYEGCG